ncbi:TPA: hypothetical protein ACH3X2_005738 [Trebouxia sp. C0005]
MTKVPGVQPATKLKVLDLYVKLIAWLEKARPKTWVNNSWAAAACQLVMTFYKVEVEPQHLSKLFGCKEATFTTQVHALTQLVVAAANGLPSSTYPECLKHISVFPVRPTAALFTDQGAEEAMENTTSRALDLSLEGDVTAVPGTAAASSCKELLQRPATSATADARRQAALPGAYAKLAVHDMINMHDVSLAIKMQVPFFPSNLAGHVKVDIFIERAHDIKKLLTTAANSSCESYSACVRKIANMPCNLLPLLPDATQAVASGEVLQAARSITPLDAAASSQQQKEADLPANVQSEVPGSPLEASPALTEQQHAVDSAEAHIDEAFNGTEAAMQREPAPAADSAQQGLASLPTCALSLMPIQPSLIPQAPTAAQGMAVTNSRELRSQTEAAAFVTQEADLDGLHTADLDPGTIPHPHVSTPHQLALSQGPPAPAARAQTSDAVMSDDSDLGLHKLQSGTLASRVRVAEQAQRPMLQLVLHRLSHSSSEHNSAASTADRLAQREQSQAQILTSGEQQSASQPQSAVACLSTPLSGQGGFPMQQQQQHQQQQQPLAVLQGPAVQQLHKLLQQLETTAQTNASVALPAQPNEHLHAATVAGHALEDGLPASWVRTAPAHSQQHELQQAAPVSLPAAGNSDPSDRGPSPWVLLPGPLHAVIACAMAQEGASSAPGGSSTAAQGLSLVGPDGTQGRGVKRPRADSAARANSTGRPGQETQHVDTVSRHALASQPAAAQVKSASILSRNAAGERHLTTRLSPASEQPAALVQLGSNLRLADGGTAGSAHQDDSSTPADLTHAAKLAVEAVPAQQAHSAAPPDSPAAGFESPVQAASALQDNSPQPAEQIQLKVPASDSDQQEKHLDGEQDTRQGTPPLHDGSPGRLPLARSRVPKQGRSEATLGVSMSGAEHNGTIDVDVSRVAMPLRTIVVGVDDMAPPSSKKRRINEHEAQDALLLLHDHEPQEALQQQQGTDSESRAGAREHVASVDSVEQDMTKDAVVRPPPFTDVDGNPDAYEVDRIIDHRSWHAGNIVRVQYLVRWKGYGPEDDTWLSKTSLRHAREAIQDYHNCMQ